MRVGIFVYPLSDAEVGGVQQYAERLIAALEKYTDTETVIFCSPWNKEKFRKYVSGNVSLFTLSKNYKYIRGFFHNKYIATNRLLSSSIKLFFYNRYMREIMATLGDYEKRLKDIVDVIHFPYQHLDRYYLHLPTVITLHDLQQEHHPEFFSKREIKWRAIVCKKSAELSSRIIVSYEHVKKDIVKFYHIPPDKIDVCRMGFEQLPNIDEKIFTIVQKKYHIPEEYIIYSAQTWPHKNHIRLIQALKRLHDNYHRKIHLVCTGKKNEFYMNIKKQIIALNLNYYVTFTDYVADDELLALLKKAKASVIPTLYEAGSYPLMEAMAVGTPVICSNVTSLPEQIGDQRFVFNPNDVEELASKLYLIITDDTVRRENIENGKRQIERISWQKMIPNFINTYSRALSDFYARNDSECN